VNVSGTASVNAAIPNFKLLLNMTWTPLFASGCFFVLQLMDAEDAGNLRIRRRKVKLARTVKCGPLADSATHGESRLVVRRSWWLSMDHYSFSSFKILSATQAAT
jgi:hypothetical protein